MDIKPDDSNTVAIKKFFYEGTPAGEFMKELKKLTDVDKQELGDGIRDGSLTYWETGGSLRGPSTFSFFFRHYMNGATCTTHYHPPSR